MMTTPSESVASRMATLVDRLAPNEGYTQSALPGVRFSRANQPCARVPVLYEPGIFIVCQGRKRAYLGDEVHAYDPQHYLVLSVPLPFSAETEASPEEPLLAVSLSLDLTVVADLVLAIDQAGGPAAEAPRSMVSTPMEAPLAEAVLRLLEVLSRPLEARILGPAMVREIFFRALIGAQGGAVRAALVHRGQFGKVAKALRRIHADYAEGLDVSRLASEAGMSAPAFHAHFKAITHTSPIQYLKSTRLHQARLLLIRDGLTAAAASARVGYESPSQFSREFKRFFGRAPAEEARQMRSLLTLTPAQAGAQYITAE